MGQNYAVQTIEIADGARVKVRPIKPDDAPRMQAFATRLSPRTIYLRTNMAHSASLSDQEAAAATDIDGRTRMALVAVTGVNGDEEIIAIARYADSQDIPGQAEVGIIVEDAYQGRGIGSQLLNCLVEYARRQGLKNLVATVSRQNQGVLSMIRRTGLQAEYQDSGWCEYRVTLSLRGLPRANGHSWHPGGSLLAALRRYWK